ncbi:MAG: GIY-YIG nuclease family protein [Candidatus Omnitrophota bacterium]
MWYVYIIEKNDRYYTGIATNLRNRLRQHKVKLLLFKQTFVDKNKAVQREQEIKGWSRSKKSALIVKFCQ